MGSAEASPDDGSGRDDAPANDATAAAADYTPNTEVKETSYELGSGGRKLEATQRHG